jgi:hypothetical protein
MDTLGVIGEDIVLSDVVNSSHRRAFPVAFSAQHWNVHFVSAGIHISGRQDIMLAVAFAAGRSIGGPSLERPAVNAGHEIFPRLVMAHSAGDVFQIFRVGEILYICVLVTIDAVHLLMNRAGIQAKVHVHGYGAALPFRGQIAVRMAGFTIFIGLG